MFGPLIPRFVAVEVAQIPRLARLDRQATPRAHRRARLDHPLPPLPQLLVEMPVPSRSRRTIPLHVVSLANSGRDFLTARVSGGVPWEKTGTLREIVTMGLQLLLYGGGCGRR